MRATKTIAYILGTSALGAVTIVAQDALVVGGSSLPPGVAPAPVAAPAPAAAPAPQAPPARSPFAPSQNIQAAPQPMPQATYEATPPTVAPVFQPAPPVPVAPAPVMGGSSLPPQPLPPHPAPLMAAVPATGLTAAQPDPVMTASRARPVIPAESRGYYPGRDDKGYGYTPDYSPAPSTGSFAGGLRGRAPYAPPAATQYAQVTGGSSLPPGVGGSSVPPTAPPPPQRLSWAQKLGLGNISTRIFGHAKAGAGARDESTITTEGDWEETLIADALLGAEVSAITQRGWEYGARVELRGGYDDDLTLLGGQVGGVALGACPVGTACAGQTSVGGTTFALRGHTSQLFSGLRGFDSGFEDDARIVIEGAHLFLRTGYGDVTLGRDVGAGELFSLGAPTLLSLGGSNGRADYTSLSVVTTANNASGHSEKITYTTPRIGGDRIGVGIQFGASYAPDVDACGVYACLRRNGSDKAAGSLGATLDDAIELGLAIDRTMGEIKAEVTATYATASNDESAVAQSLAAFDDLQSWNLGAEVQWRNLTLGGSYLSSNNALADGDYTAWDAGLTYELGQWGATLGYAHAQDDNVGVESDEYLLGLSRELGEGLSVGGGLQYIERDVPVLLLDGTLGRASEDATAIFIETGWEF